MHLTLLDLLAFVAFLTAVVGISLYASRRDRDSDESYFLAGRTLTWPLIGISLVASNISTEHFVGMAGSAFGRVGLAIASYEWMAAVTLILIGWYLLPLFLRTGIYTMPEFLEYRYNPVTRAIMATLLMIAYVVVAMATVLYSGAVGLNAIFNIPQWFQDSFGMGQEQATFWATVAGIWFIGLIAGAYTAYGGLKAVVWSDLLQGGGLILGGATVAVIGFVMIGGGDFFGGVGSFLAHNEAKLHTVLPWNDPDVPWLAVFIGGLWIPNTFYWGMNQFITQRTLAARSLREGQRGIIFAAFLKLLMPFIIVFPGIMAFQLFGGEIIALFGVEHAADHAYPYMIQKILPPSLRGIMLAALFGAVMSSFNSMLNSASTILSMDLYKRHWKPEASQRAVVRFGRIATVGFVLIACLWAPVISRFEGVFVYIQKIWGFISPGIVAAFLVGIILRKTPPIAASGAMLLGIPLYAAVILLLPGASLLHHIGITFVLLVLFMLVMTWRRPLPEPVVLPDRGRIDTTPTPGVRIWGWAVIALTALLYVAFW